MAYSVSTTFKRRLKPIGISWLVLLGLWLGYWQLNREPEYQGKTVTQWIGEFQTVSRVIPAYSLEESPERGSNGHYRLTLVVAEATGLRTNTIFIAKNVIVPEKLTSEKARSSHYYLNMLADPSAVALREIGPAAIPALLNNLRNKAGVATKLRQFAREHAPDGIRRKFVHEPAWDQMRRNAAVLIGLMGRSGPTVVPGLTKALADPVREVREAAAEALGWQGSDARPAVSALVTALKAPDFRVGLQAFLALDRIGPDAKESVQAAVTWAQANLPDDRRHDIVKEHHLGGPVAAQVLAGLMARHDLTLRCGATRLAGNLGEQGSFLLPDLVSLLRHQEISLQYAAIEALQGLGPVAKKALPELRKLGEDANPNLASAAKKAAEKIAGDQK